MSGLPVAIFCPFCKRHTSLTPAPVTDRHDDVIATAQWKKRYEVTWWIGVCNYCQEPVLILNDGYVVYPQPLPSPTDERIPDPMRRDLNEAKVCMSVDAHRACAVMARRTMQSACVDKGASKDKLADQLQELVSNIVITKDLKEWADVVRWVGNDAAHPDNESVSKQDAEDILNLAEQFLHVIYVAPAIAKQHRTKRDK